MTTAIVVIVIIALLALAIFTQFQARKQFEVRTPLPPEDAAHIVQKYFGPIWTQVNGKGRFNYRPKLRKAPPTISIDVQPSPGRGSEVHIWVSEWSTYFGFMNHATLVWRKKRGLASRLLPASASPEPSTTE